MKKEMTPDMYNYNKFPGPIFYVQNQDCVLSDDFEFKLILDYRAAFDIEKFNQRFSEMLAKFDYLVGDFGSEQLRLKGFYSDERPVKNKDKISRLDDYLLEYCNPGCPYFILENRKIKTGKQYYNHKNAKAKSGRKKEGAGQFNSKAQPNRQKNKSNRSEKERQKKNRHFVIRNKER